MNIQDAFKQEPHYIQDSPFVQVIVQLLQRQTEQIQSQIEKISTLVSCQCKNYGYNLLNLVLASSEVNCQSAILHRFFFSSMLPLHLPYHLFPQSFDSNIVDLNN